MYSMNRVYRNNFTTYNGPALVEVLNNILRMGSENVEIFKVLQQAIPDTKNNRAILFWKDPVPVSFSYIEAYTTHGNGMKFVIDDPGKRASAMEVLDSFNSRINTQRQSVDDVYSKVTTDNNVFARSIWRLLFTDDSEVGLDLARLDPLTFDKWTDDKKGWECIVQKPYTIAGTYASRNAFYNAMAQNTTTPLAASMPQANRIVIPNEPEYILEFEFYERPPISTVLDGLLYKQWILWYMKMYSDRYWAPFKMGYIGDPKSGEMPQDPTQMSNQQMDLLNGLLNMRTAGAAVTSGANRVEELGKNSAASSEIYPSFVDHLDKQTMYALSGSMGQRDARGNELAVSRTIDTNWVRTILGKRTRHKRIWTEFYLKQLLPRNGINLSHQQFHVSFSPVDMPSIYELMRAIGEGCKSVVFKDWNEPRAWIREIYDNVADVDEGLAKKMQADFMELNKKPEPAFGDGSAKPTAKKGA